VYLDFDDAADLAAAVARLRRRCVIGLVPPRIRRPGEEGIARHLASLEPDVLLVRSLGRLADGGASVRVGDFSLNVTNSVSAAEVLGRGLAAFTPAYEMDAAQLLALLGPSLAPFAEVVVHRAMPLFHTEHCLYAAHLSAGRDRRTCGRPCDQHRISVRDRTGREHPVAVDMGCRSTVFHGEARSGIDHVPALRRAGVRRLRVELLGEGRDAARRVVSTYVSAFRV
jgi:putative protease